MKEFINQCNLQIKKENCRINNLKKQINEYETVIDIVSKTDQYETIEIYREKIDKCWDKINCYLDNIKHHENAIATIKKIDKVITKEVNESA
jgi:hypothetical protein